MPECMFCEQPQTDEEAMEWSPTVGTQFHVSCATTVLELEDSGNDTGNKEEATLCLADLETRKKNLGE